MTKLSHNDKFRLQVSIRWLETIAEILEPGANDFEHREILKVIGILKEIGHGAFTNATEYKAEQLKGRDDV